MGRAKRDGKNGGGNSETTKSRAVSLRSTERRRSSPEGARGKVDLTLSLLRASPFGRPKTVLLRSTQWRNGYSKGLSFGTYHEALGVTSVVRKNHRTLEQPWTVSHPIFLWEGLVWM